MTWETKKEKRYIILNDDGEEVVDLYRTKAQVLETLEEMVEDGEDLTYVKVFELGDEVFFDVEETAIVTIR